ESDARCKVDGFVMPIDRRWRGILIVRGQYRIGQANYVLDVSRRCIWHQNFATIQVEVGRQVTAISPVRRVFIAQAQTQAQLAGYAPLVSRKPRPGVLVKASLVAIVVGGQRTYISEKSLCCASQV